LVVPEPQAYKGLAAALRWRIESAFSRLKDFRRIAARYDKAGAQLSGFCRPRRHPGMVDLMSPDPSHLERKFATL